MKKTLMFVVLFACLGLLQSCQPSARVPVDGKDEDSGAGAGKVAADAGDGAAAGREVIVLKWPNRP